jgi:hypothetical protein
MAAHTAVRRVVGSTLLIAIWICGGCGNDATRGAGSVDASPASDVPPPLVNRVWTQSPAEQELPGVMRIFLADGTLVQDSCWETHRLSRWRAEPGGRISWTEDGRTIGAEIVAISEHALVLRLQLAGGTEEQRYVAAAVPYVCPDVPR